MERGKGRKQIVSKLFPLGAAAHFIEVRPGQVGRRWTIPGWATVLYYSIEQ
ncbi:MAG: hypothetical protein GXY44_01535 [Phycisphaerales bacterium]|nr:hypothetical protein [Phycisphaerales bacterium]